ncbi:hypothetical protein FAI40_08815 [Acetobacteraceae bacterium]|nr:hypothetical protein FAI40_08815 [Acetobacteraceae bacterium]
MRLKLLVIFIGLLITCISLLALMPFLHSTNTVPASTSSNKTQGIVFKNQYAQLSLEKSSPQDKAWSTNLRIAAPQCTGALAQKGDGGNPAETTLLSGTIENGIIEVYQSPTMGEAACKIELTIQNDEIISAQQKEGDCDAWHGKSCSFSTATLGGMKRLAPNTP